ncbi:MAG: UDP-N-acetylmuramoyl-L-alanine--D-glutamate ligase [Clostridia bacterium]
MEKVLIIGKGKSGQASFKFLKNLGYKVSYILSDKDYLDYSMEKKDKLLRDLSFIVPSPAVSLHSKLIQDALNLGIKVIDETELAFSFDYGTVLAITGSNGKTTTTTLTTKILQTESNCFSGGNIGVPYVRRVTEPHDSIVLEMSSFQLEKTEKFKPHIAALLNISPDHLNHHAGMNEYINAKLKIFSNQTENDFAVLNYDDEFVRKIAPTLNAKVYFFSKNTIVRGCYIENDSIYFKDGSNSTFIINDNELKLLGDHNKENYLCAVTMAMLFGISAENIRKVLKTFSAVNHRLKYVLSINGVQFYNDSKATNIASTIASMRAMVRPTTIILGGSDKGLEFDDLFKYAPPLIKGYVCMGEMREKLMLSAKKNNIINVWSAMNFEEAILRAYMSSVSGDVVLLSPACASFDWFKDYEERGKFFVTTVREMKRVYSRDKAK